VSTGGGAGEGGDDGRTGSIHPIHSIRNGCSSGRSTGPVSISEEGSRWEHVLGGWDSSGSQQEALLARPRQGSSGPQPVQAFLCSQNDPQQQSAQDTDCTVENASVIRIISAGRAFMDLKFYPFLDRLAYDRMQMKASVIFLVVAFGAMQGVSITDCPCGSYCETKNSCPGENHHSSPSDDCCSRSGKPLENCFHLEPQTDLVVSAPEEAPPILFVRIDIDDSLRLGVSPRPGVVGREFGPSPPARDCPVFILHSSLLI
jgi:hypothetical protein